MSTDKTKKTIGKKIYRARKDVGMSQKQLAHALQISDKTVSSYEVGRISPDIDTLRDISQTVQKPLGYFLNDQLTRDVDIARKLEKVEQELTEIKRLLGEGRS